MTNIDLQQVIDESLPMLTEFFMIIGLHNDTSPIRLEALLEPFNEWIDSQEIPEEKQIFLASRLGAFICEYLIENCSGQRVIENGRIVMRVPVQDGTFREFDPYTVAIEMAKGKNTLKEFVSSFISYS